MAQGLARRQFRMWYAASVRLCDILANLAARAVVALWESSNLTNQTP